MAVRTPLKLDGGNLKEMGSNEIAFIQAQAMYLYGTSPSVTLSRVASGGTLGTITDTRLQAGSPTTDITNFDTAAETPNISTVTVNYATMSQANVNTVASADTNSVAFPVYYDAGNIRSMTLTDVYDTFIYPAINLLVNGGDHAGTFRIHTATTLAGHTLISATPVYSDTGADTSLYTATGIYEVQDQPTTVTNYYLFRTNAAATPPSDNAAYRQTIFIRNADTDLQEYPQVDIDALLLNCIRHVASEVVGHKISYNLNGTGNNKGSGMVNTILSGTGSYQTYQVNTNDYRTQEFPDGTPITVATHYLRITKV